MILYKLSTGDMVHKYKKSIVVEFNDARKVLSTSFINGGYREDLRAVFNYDEKPEEGMECRMRADTYPEHMRLVVEELGLDPDYSAGITTAATMDNVSIKSLCYEDVTVTAIVTAGISVNAGRVGDIASFHEQGGRTVAVKPGTINIILVTDADLPPETMTRVLVTCTEAKTAALQELMVGSCYSSGLATGTGTDGVIVVSNSKSETKLLYAGKHSKLGELIGNVVKPAVKEAISLESRTTPQSQHRVLKRVKRFGITEEKIWKKFNEIGSQVISRSSFIKGLEMADKDGELVAITSMYVHLMDQLSWELLSPDEVVNEAGVLLKRINDKYNLYLIFDVQSGSIKETIESMTESFTVWMASIAEACQ